MISTAQWIACRWRKRWCHNTTHQLECKRGLLLRCYDIESSARVCERESALGRCVIYNMSKCAIVKRSNKIARDEWIFYESKTDWCTSNNILFYSVFHFRCVCERVYVLYICSSLQRDMNTLVSAKHACEHWIRIFSRISVYAELFFMYAYFALVSTLYDIGCETRCRSFVRCCFGSVQNIWHTSEERTQKPTHHHHHHSYPFTPKWNK